MTLDPETLTIAAVAGCFGVYLAASVGAYYLVEWLSKRKP